MNATHARAWAKIVDDAAIEAKAMEIYPDTLEPACDRSALRSKWVGAIRKARASAKIGGRGLGVDRRVLRRAEPFEWGAA